MNQALWTRNRKKLAAALPADTVTVVFSRTPPRKSADEEHIYSVDRNFYYLTGIRREDLVLVIRKLPRGTVQEQLYLPPVDELQEKWVGRFLRPDEARSLSGIEEILPRGSFMDDMARLLGDIVGPETVYIPTWLAGWDEPDNEYRAFAAWIRSRFPAVTVRNAMKLIAPLRHSKEPEEVAEIRAAIGTTKEALEFVMEQLRPGMYEYELAADYVYRCLRRNGCPNSLPICAAGKNATVLHYREESAVIQHGDLVLLDWGGTSNLYCADITRTYPASGKFTPRQRELYEIVLEAQLVAMDAMKVGVAKPVVNDAVKKFYAKALKTVHLIRDERDVDRYYYHNVGHSLGLDVHDIDLPDRTIGPNSVFTVEPGLYVAEEGIGIRIEEDVLVTEQGVTVLSDEIIKSVNDIENFMK